MVLEEKYTSRTAWELVVVKLVEGGPAHTSHRVQVGDVLKSVDGEAVAGRPLEHVVPMIVGQVSAAAVARLGAARLRASAVRPPRVGPARADRGGGALWAGGDPGQAWARARRTAFYCLPRARLLEDGGVSQHRGKCRPLPATVWDCIAARCERCCDLAARCADATAIAVGQPRTRSCTGERKAGIHSSENPRGNPRGARRQCQQTWTGAVPQSGLFCRHPCVSPR